MYKNINDLVVNNAPLAQTFLVSSIFTIRGLFSCGMEVDVLAVVVRMAVGGYTAWFTELKLNRQRHTDRIPANTSARMLMNRLA